MSRDEGFSADTGGTLGTRWPRWLWRLGPRSWRTRGAERNRRGAANVMRLTTLPVPAGQGARRTGQHLAAGDPGAPTPRPCRNRHRLPAQRQEARTRP